MAYSDGDAQLQKLVFNNNMSIKFAHATHNLIHKTDWRKRKNSFKQPIQVDIIKDNILQGLSEELRCISEGTEKIDLSRQLNQVRYLIKSEMPIPIKRECRSSQQEDMEEIAEDE